MSQLSQRALRVYSVLESYRGDSRDILEALLPFFEPTLFEYKGRLLDQNDFASKIREIYRWSFTPDIVEELIPRFQNRRWVEEARPRTKPPSYNVTYDNPLATPLGPNDAHIGQVLSRVAAEFQHFIKELSPLTAFARSEDELADILVEWLVSIDAYNEDVLRQQTIQVSEDSGTLGAFGTHQDISGLTSEERYLCARFVKKLNAEKSPYIADLCKLASVGLLTEVIQDFRKPSTSVSKTDLNIYLDAPVALDLLGASGNAAAENIRPIISKLREIGGQVRIFRASVQELQRVLDAILKRPHVEREGATATAMRRGEVLEAYINQIVRDPDTVLSTYNVGIVDRTLDSYPSDHSFFTDENYESIFGQMNWHVGDVTRREHDSTVITLLARMRRSTKSPDLFKTKHLLITRNGPLAQLAKSFCVSQGLISRSDVAPVIHQRQLATAIWLRTGLQDMQDVPRRYVLAACERVLELKKTVVDHVRITARTLTPETEKQLELLLTQDRSIQLLLDKTLGVSNVISPSNIEYLVDDMKRSLADEFAKDRDSKVAEAKNEADSRVRKANEARRSAEKVATSLSDVSKQLASEDRRVIEHLVGQVNRKLALRRRIIKYGIGALIFLIGILPSATEALSGLLKFILCGVSGSIGAAFAFLQVFDRTVGLEKRLEKWARNKLTDEARTSQLLPKLIRCEIEYINGMLNVKPWEEGRLSV